LDARREHFVMRSSGSERFFLIRYTLQNQAIAERQATVDALNSKLTDSKLAKGEGHDSL
jgi:hypothetical protein